MFFVQGKWGFSILLLYIHSEGYTFAEKSLKFVVCRDLHKKIKEIRILKESSIFFVRDLTLNNRL